MFVILEIILLFFFLTLGGVTPLMPFTTKQVRGGDECGFAFLDTLFWVCKYSLTDRSLSRYREHHDQCMYNVCVEAWPTVTGEDRYRELAYEVHQTTGRLPNRHQASSQ